MEGGTKRWMIESNRSNQQPKCGIGQFKESFSVFVLIQEEILLLENEILSNSMPKIHKYYPLFWNISHIPAVTSGYKDPLTFLLASLGQSFKPEVPTSNLLIHPLAHIQQGQQWSQILMAALRAWVRQQTHFCLQDLLTHVINWGSFEMINWRRKKRRERKRTKL